MSHHHHQRQQQRKQQQWQQRQQQERDSRLNASRVPGAFFFPLFWHYQRRRNPKKMDHRYGDHGVSFFFFFIFVFFIVLISIPFKIGLRYIVRQRRYYQGRWGPKKKWPKRRSSRLLGHRYEDHGGPRDSSRAPCVSFFFLLYGLAVVRAIYILSTTVPLYFL